MEHNESFQNMTSKDICARFGAVGLELRPAKSVSGETFLSTFVDQYGRVLEAYLNKNGSPDLRPVGLVGKGEYR